MANGGKITFGVGFDVDQSGLEKLKIQLNELKKISPSQLLEINPNLGNINQAKKEIAEIRKTINGVDIALDKAFNTDLGVLNVQKFSQSLKSMGINNVAQSFSKMGAAGVQAFNELATKALTVNIQLKETKSIFDKMGETLINTLNWNISSSTVNALSNSIQQAWGYAKHLDSSLNDIRIVTSKSADEMDRFAEKANKAAKRLGASTTDYAEASLIYYQQGLSDEETAARAETTIKAANVTGQSGEAVSEQLTAVWNGYKVSAEEAELYIDKLAAVAATTASDLEELSTGMSKVASAAAIMGVDIDQLNAQLATIVSVTREAPESIGTALKTVYARMSDIKAGLDGEVTLDEYTQQMLDMGINVLDAEGNLRDMGDVIEEIGGKWQSMTREQQTSLAQTIAGTRQYSRMMALFDNWDMYTDALNTSANAAGTLNEQNEIYLESTEAHLIRLKAAQEGLFDSLIDTKGINEFIDTFTKIIEKTEVFIDTIGGGKGALLGLSAILSRVFSKQIAQQIEPMITGIQGAKHNAQALQQVLTNINNFSAKEGFSSATADAMKKAQLQLSQYWNVMSAEEINQSQRTVEEIGKITQLTEEWKNATAAVKEYVLANANQTNQKTLQNKDFSNLTTYEDKIVQQTLDTTKNKIDSLAQSYQNLKNAQNKASSANESRDIDKKIEAYKNLSKSIQEMINKIQATPKSITNQKDIENLTNLQNQLDGTIKKLEKKNHASKKAIVSTQDMTKGIKDAEKATSDAEKKYKQTTDAINKQREAQEKLNKANADLKIPELDTRYIVQNLSNVISGFSSLAFTINSISSIGDILTDDDLSSLEKATRIMMSLGTITMSVSGVFKGFSAVTNLVTMASMRNAAAVELETTAENKNTLSKVKNIAITKTAAGGKNILVLAERNLEKAIAKGVITEEVANIVREKGITSLGAETIAKIAATGGTQAMTGAVIKDTVATLANAAAKAILNPKVLLVAGSVALLTGAVYGAIKAFNAEADAAKKAAKIHEDTKKNYDSIKQGYENIKSSLESYQSARDAISEMTKGTEEWNNAVFELNNQVSELIQKYPQLTKYMTNNQGILGISQEGMDVLFQESQQAMYEAMAATSRSSAIKSQADYNLIESKNDSVYIEGNQENDIDGGWTNTENIIDFAQTYGGIDALIGALNKNDIAAEGIVKALNEATGISLTTAADWVNSLNNERDTLIEVETALKANEEAIRANNKIIAKGMLQDDEIYQELNDNGKIIAEEITSQRLDNTEVKTNRTKGDIQEFQKENKDTLGEYGDNLFLKDTNDETDAKLVLDALGIDYQSISEAGGNKFKYVDTEGQTHTMEYSDYYDQVLAYLQDISDTEKSKKDIEKYNTAIEELKGVYGEEYTEMLETYLATGSLTGYTDQQITGFQESGIIDDSIATFVEKDLFIKFFSQPLSKIDNAITDALNRENKVDVFKNENAQSIATSTTNLLENGRYLTPEIVAQNADYNNLIKNAELIKELYPSIAADMDMINQYQKAGSEDWLKSLENVQAYMGAIAEDADGIWTKEDAEQYGTTTDDLDIALAQGDIDQATYNQKFQGSFEYETEALDLDTEAVLDHADALQDMALAEEDVADALAKDDKAAKKVAKMHAQMNKGVEALAENYEDIAEILSDDTQKSTSEYLGALDDLRDIMGDVLTMDADQLSEGFLTSAENMELMKLAAQGDTDAIDQLRVAASNDIILQAIGKSDFTSLDQELQDEIAYVNQLAADNDFEIGAKLDNTDFLNACMDIVNQAGMTAEEATNYLASMGIDATVTKVPADTVAEHTWVSPKVTKLPGGYYAVTGTKKVTARDTTKGGAGFALEVSNATYGGRSGGGINKKSSGGGGGGGGSSKAPDRASYIEDKSDRYHDVNIELTKLATAYERLGKAQEKLISGDLIDNLNEQLEVLQKQILTYKEKLKLMEEEKSELQGELGAQGVQFSEDGSISNYNDALINRLNQANAEIDRYNQMTAEQQEATKDANGKTLANRATEDYEAFKEALDRYDTLTSEEIPELQDNIQDAIDQQIEIQIQKFNMGIEVQLDMAEATKEFNEWKAKVIDGLKDDDLLGNTKLTMENMQIYFDPSQGEGLMTQTASHLQQVMDEIAVMQGGGTGDIYGDNMAAAMEDLTKYQEELMNQTTEWADYVQEVQDNYLEMIDEANDKIDEQRENYEFINNQLEHSLSIIEKMHGDGAYEEMAQIYELQRQSYEEQLAFQRQEVELWAQRMEEARLSGDTEALEKYTENWKDAQEELNSLVETALDNLLTEYENAVNLAFDKLNEKVTGGMGLDYVGEEWELANQNAEMYLDTINEAFAIDQLRNKYQKSINETSNLDTQKKLNDLMEKEIAALEKKDRLTQYDVERANMKYDIALKQIALEEAQQNKTTMRLKRDSQGNYTYQYTSDDDAVANAQQQLAEAQNSLYNFDKENYQNNLDQMLSVYTEFQQKMAEAALINDEEQRQARMLMLQEQYGQLINGITAENEVIRYNLHESAFDELATNVYGKNVEEFYNMSQEEQDEIMSGLVPTWEGGVQQMADVFSNGFLPTCQETFNQIDIGYEELKAGMSTVAEQARIDFQTYVDGTQPAIDKMKELVQDNKDVVTEMNNQLSSMQALRDQALEMDDAYAPYLKAVEDLVDKSQNLRQAEADVTTELSKQKTILDDLTVSFTNAIAKLKEYNNTSVESKDTSNSGDGGGSTSVYTGDGDEDSSKTWRVFVDGVKKTGGNWDTLSKSQAQQEASIFARGGHRVEIEYTYDTGGYTGEWAGGSERENGRLAFLHQKELVLNEHDTANFLTAIQITRGMSGVLESVANRIASIGSTLSSNVANTSNGIQQQITINADFPDATSATEIEEALLSLVNRASQQAFNVNI